MGDTEELIAFVTARLAEIEVAARAATPGPWTDTGQRDVFVEQLATSAGTLARDLHLIAEMERCDDHPDRRRADAEHIVLHDPVRALRDAEAGRKLLREYERLLERKRSHEANRRAAQHYTPFTAPGWPSAYDLQREGHFLEQAIPLVHGLVVAKASAWSDHRDYRAAWSQRVRPWPSPS